MPTNIESRIVSMEFDNSNFEKNVATSQKTLKALDEQLKFKDADKNFQTLSNAASKVSFSSVVSSAEDMAFKIKTSTIAGAEVIKRLTNAAIDLGQTVVSKVISPISAAMNQIQTGGWNRATNIDQAKFQLEGLGVAWEEIKEDIEYGVNDTAYGLDSAARVASQLVASSVELGDDMKAALRGVSGVAAMTNSSYDDIGAIFTRVAGQGRVMANDLNSLASRGLNAAATLGEAMGYTEAEIREMVSKGQISFAMFAEAMDNAFGEHAKDANNTFEGAMANMNSALSRIGAEFATSYRANMVPVYNSLRGIFNGIKGSMDSVFLVSDAIMTDLSERFVKYADVFKQYVIDSGALKAIFEGITNFGTGIYMVITDVIDTFVSKIKIVQPVVDAFDAVRLSYGEFTDGLEKNPFAKIAGSFKGMSERFLEMVDNEEFIDKIVKKVETVASITKSIFTVIGSIVKSVLTIGRIIGKLVGSIISIVSNVASMLGFGGKTGSGITGLFSSIANGSTKISDLLLVFEKWLDDNEIFEKIVSKVTNAISKFFGWIQKGIAWVKSVSQAFDDWVKATTGLSVIEHLHNAFDSVVSFFTSIPEKIRNTYAAFDEWVTKVTGSSIEDHFNNIKETVGKAIDKVKEFFFSIGRGKEVEDAEKKMSPFVKIWETIKNIFSGIAEFFKAIWPFISSIFTSIGDTVGNLFHTLADGVKDIEFDDLGSVFAGGGALAGGTGLLILGKSLSKFASTLTSGIDSVTGDNGFLAKLNGLLGSLKDTLAAYQADLKADAIMKIAKAIAILAASVLVLSLIKPEKLVYSTLALETLIGSIQNLTQKMYKLADSGNGGADKGFMKLATGMMLMAFGLLMISGAVKKLGNMDTDALIQGMFAVEILIWTFKSLVKQWSKNKVSDDTGIVTLAVSFLVLALALKALVKPISKLGQLPVNVLAKGLGSVAIMLLMMIKTAKSIASVADDAKVAGKALKSMATALLIMTIPVLVLGHMKLPVLAKGIGSVALMMLSMAGAVAIIAWAVKKNSDTASTLKGVSAVLLSLAVSVGILTLAVRGLQNVEWSALGKAGAILAGMVAAIVILEVFTSRFGGAINTVAIAATILALAIAIKILVKPLESLDKIEWKTIAKLAAVLGVLVLAAGLAAIVVVPLAIALVVLSAGLFIFSVALLAVGGAMTLASAGFVAFGVGLATLVPALAAFAILDKGIKNAGLVLLGLLLAVAALGAIGKFLGVKAVIGAAASLMVVALALTMMVVPLTALTAIKWGSIGKAVVILGSMVLLIGALAVVTSKFGGGKDTLVGISISLLAMAAALTLLVIPLKAMADISWEQIAKAAVVMLTLVAALAILSLLGPALVVVGLGLKSIGEGVLFASLGLAIFGVALWAISALLGTTVEGALQTLIDATPKFMEWLTVLITGLLQVIIDTLPKLGEVLSEAIPVFLDSVTLLLQAIADHAYEWTLALVDIVVGIILGVIDGIANHAEEIWMSIFNLVYMMIRGFILALGEFAGRAWTWIKESFWPSMKEKFFNIKETGEEIMEKLGEGIDSAIDSVIGFFEDMWQGIKDFFSGIWQGVKDLGAKFVGFFKGGAEDDADLAYEMGATLGDNAIAGLQESTDTHSPSEESTNIGSFFGEGLSNGISSWKDTIFQDGVGLGESGLDGLSEGFSGMGDLLSDKFGELEENGDTELGITPVLDMDGFSLDSLFGGDNTISLDGSSFMSSFTSDNAAAIEAAETNNQLSSQIHEELQAMRDDNLVAASAALQAGLDNTNAMQNQLTAMQSEITRIVNNLQTTENQNMSRTNSEISNVRSDLAMVATAINNMRLVLDSGALVGEMTPKIDVALGRIAAYKGRGN